VTPRPRRRTDPRRGVPYNPLLDQGYRSIGDVHANDAGERSGRWQGKNKTECGLHSNYWDMKKRFEASKAGQGEGVAEQAPAEPNGAA
jgi:phosphoadenosine phosphosulfate reductase